MFVTDPVPSWKKEPRRTDSSVEFTRERSFDFVEWRMEVFVEFRERSRFTEFNRRSETSPRSTAKIASKDSKQKRIDGKFPSVFLLENRNSDRSINFGSFVSGRSSRNFDPKQRRDVRAFSNDFSASGKQSARFVVIFLQLDELFRFKNDRRRENLHEETRNGQNSIENDVFREYVFDEHRNRWFRMEFTEKRSNFLFEHRTNSKFHRWNSLEIFFVQIRFRGGRRSFRFARSICFTCYSNKLRVDAHRTQSFCEENHFSNDE